MVSNNVLVAIKYQRILFTKSHLAEISYKKNLVRDCAKSKTAMCIVYLNFTSSMQKICQEYGHIFAKKLCPP